jgi:hypothetical protein
MGAPTESHRRYGRRASAQPRPAFGFRPWFAFERRALSFRFFAFAIVGASVPTPDGYRRVGLVAPGWRLDDVHVAVGHTARRLGVTAEGIERLALSTRSIHTFGVGRALRVTVLDGDGTVVASEVVAPRRVRVWPRRMWVIETPPDISPPPIGTAIRVVASSGHAGNPDRVRHTDRQPG